MDVIIVILGILWDAILWLLKLIFSIVLFPFKKLIKKEQVDLTTDPVVSEIVTFFHAARGITDKSEFARCWLNIYPNKGTMQCMYLEVDHCAVTWWEGQIRKYGRDEHREDLRKALNIDAFPSDTIYELDDDFEGYKLLFKCSMRYPKSAKLYADVIVNECSTYGIPVKANGVGDIEIEL